MKSQVLIERGIYLSADYNIANFVCEKFKIGLYFWPRCGMLNILAKMSMVEEGWQGRL